MLNIPPNYIILTDTCQKGDLYKRVTPYISHNWMTITTDTIQKVSIYPDFIFIRRVTKTERGNNLN